MNSIKIESNSNRNGKHIKLISILYNNIFQTYVYVILRKISSKVIYFKIVFKIYFKNIFQKLSRVTMISLVNHVPQHNSGEIKYHNNYDTSVYFV